MSASLPPNEAQRLAALHAYSVLDTEPEGAFDDLVKLASEICGTPIALITLVDESRQWFKARVGFDEAETPREYAFCAHAILDEKPLVVLDATEDARFRDNPYVVGDPNVRFYAGAPLRTREGYGLGTLCVIDDQARAERPLEPHQLRALELLSKQAVRLLEYRKVAAQLSDALEQVRTLAPLVPVCAWCRRVRDDSDFWTSVEEYLDSHAGVKTTHGICPTCSERLKEELDERL